MNLLVWVDQDIRILILSISKDAERRLFFALFTKLGKLFMTDAVN
jgi:hypothetical protein